METLSNFENNEQIPSVHFVYDKEWDLKCLINKGPGGQYSPSPTKAYKELIAHAGENPTRDQASEFIQRSLEEKGMDIEKMKEEYALNSKEILEKFKTEAERIFGVQIPPGTRAYLTVNNRCPYDIKNNWFYATISSTPKVINISMHELWHFYTWYKFGIKEEELGELGSKRYGDLKEALTVLLNPQCANLLPEGEIDNGYPQHRALREKIVALWNQNPDIEFIWEAIRKE